MIRFASLLALAAALLLGGGLGFAQNPDDAHLSGLAEGVEQSEGLQGGIVAAANPCTHDLNLTYADGTLTLGFELGTTQISEWNGWLIFPVLRPLWSMLIPPVDPPVTFDVTTAFPSIGPIGIISWVVTSDLITCFVFDSVDTGAPSSPDASSVDELHGVQESIRKAKEMFTQE